MAGDCAPLTAGALDGVPHGFFTRDGGVSTGDVGGLQCGIGAKDDPLAVAENRARATAAIAPGATLLTPHQVHSPDVAIVRQAFAMRDRPHVDALVTAQAGLLLGIVTADCAPVLLADRAHGVVGAAHAGWRGALHGVLANTVEAMVALGARRESIAAAVGPCIAQESYEVGEDMRGQFDAAAARFFAPGKPGHLQFDLAGYVAKALADAGVETVDVLGEDTYGQDNRFYSYRRATHRGEPTYGRQLSAIAVA